jgi:uncharacterized protein YbaR (Trm112 family)
LTKDLLEILACPECKGNPLILEHTDGEEVLACPACKIRFPVVNGIPDMLPRPISDDLSSDNKEWKTWSVKLGNFVQWRKRTWNGAPDAHKTAAYVDEIKKRFVDFTGLRDSGRKIIDIGCGNGAMKELLGACGYYGVDPLLIEGHQYDFPIVRGVGEHLSFRNGSFDAVLLNQVLDHCNSINKVIDEAVRVGGDHVPLCVMQYLSEPAGFANRLYKKLSGAYHALWETKSLDVKTRRFDRKGLINYFRARFDEVDSLEYSQSQIFIRAAGRKAEHRQVVDMRGNPC